uniref:Uncharacterized protein n=1 Tax=Knipowitschia caucasica TaxID=637954 RepID=A0AAV2M0L0_KNICA
MDTTTAADLRSSHCPLCLRWHHTYLQARVILKLLKQFLSSPSAPPPRPLPHGLSPTASPVLSAGFVLYTLFPVRPLEI